MRDHVKRLIEQYTIELAFLEKRYNDERRSGKSENESYFWGQWCKLGNVICDLKSLMKRDDL